VTYYRLRGLVKYLLRSAPEPTKGALQERVKKLHQAQLRVLVEEQAQVPNAGGIQETFLRYCVRYGLVESPQVDYLVSAYTLLYR
jgi:hypothetical protein